MVFSSLDPGFKRFPISHEGALCDVSLLHAFDQISNGKCFVGGGGEKMDLLLLLCIYLSFCIPRYAILCGLLSEYESIQNKIKNGYLFKVNLINTNLIAF